MNRIAAKIGIAALALGVSAPAFAQHVAPPSTSFTATGAASLNGTNCTLTLTGDTNAAGTGGTITGGSNTGLGVCPAITIDSGGTFTIDSYNPAGSGSAGATLNGLVVRVNGVVACTQASPLGFSITNDGSGGSQISLSGNVDVCTVSAELDTPDVTVTS